ncbi:MAG: MoxR family ATPase [Rhodospirillales bacterium]|nr:MoxR family ATPase [Rhodospirillales bacterium]
MSVRPSFVELRRRLEAGMVGQNQTVLSLMIGLLADGHILLEGAPGLAKTRVARLLALGMEGVFNRIQFTPDLLPSDLTGSSIYDAREQRFDFQTGPVFGNFILADEINRAPAKVQSALLEAMEERQVTSGTRSFKLESPFFVIATQNPIEHEGTWELPQAQLDRFLLHVTVDYPDLATEREILDLVLQEAVDALTPAEAPASIPKADLAEARRLVLDVHLSEPIRDYIVRLMSGTRGDPESLNGVDEHLSHPVSPRGSVSLARTAQARAWLMERDHVLPEDVYALVPDVLRHRMGLTYRAEADGVTPDQIIQNLLEQVSVV